MVINTYRVSLLSVRFGELQEEVHVGAEGDHEDEAHVQPGGVLVFYINVSIVSEGGHRFKLIIAYVGCCTAQAFLLAFASFLTVFRRFASSGR
jgi:hypothetical protein